MKRIIPNKKKNQTPVLETVRSDERNWRWHRQTERYSVFLGWQNQYCQNALPKAIYSFNAYPNTNGIFHRTRKQILKVCKET